MVMDPIELSRKIRAALAPCSLGTWPTPVDTRPDLAPATGRAELWLKREDLTSPRCGGNKVRGLEFLLAGLPAGMVCVTVGGFGSTHCLATATHARDLGLRTVLAQFPQPETATTRALAVASVARADVVVRSRSRAGFPAAARLRPRSSATCSPDWSSPTSCPPRPTPSCCRSAPVGPPPGSHSRWAPWDGGRWSWVCGSPPRLSLTAGGSRVWLAGPPVSSRTAASPSPIPHPASRGSWTASAPATVTPRPPARRRGSWRLGTV